MIDINTLIGKKYGKLTILSEADRTIQGGVNYRCVNVGCDCGKIVVKKLKAILKTNGGTKSCGCSFRGAKLSEVNKPNLSFDSKKKVRGIGIIGEGQYPVKYVRQGVVKYTLAFETWLTRLKSVVSVNYKKRRKGFKGVEVAEEWLNYQNFAKWFYEQVKLYGKGGVVDKDLLFLGNKVYSPTTCCYIPQAINALFSMKSDTKGFYLKKGKYSVSVNIDGVRKYIGSYDDEDSAKIVYFQTKLAEVKKIILRYQDKIHPALFYKLYHGTENYLNYYMFEKENSND